MIEFRVEETDEMRNNQHSSTRQPLVSLLLLSSSHSFTLFTSLRPSIESDLVTLITHEPLPPPPSPSPFSRPLPLPPGTLRECHDQFTLVRYFYSSHLVESPFGTDKSPSAQIRDIYFRMVQLKSGLV